jgi:putative ABC transport system permease protein
MSALTKPEDALARRDPKTMNRNVRSWYCSPYVQSIAFQLQEVIPHSHADQIRQVAQNEGTVLSRIKGLMLLIRWRRCSLPPWRFQRRWQPRSSSGDVKSD